MLLSDEDGCAERLRTERYRGLADSKRRAALGGHVAQDYYAGLLSTSAERSDEAVAKDRKQITKDLPRTFSALPPQRGAVRSEEALLPLLWRIITAYIERGRYLCSTSKSGVAQGPGSRGGAATTARGLLTGYPQGLNFLAGMSLLCAGAVRWDGSGEEALEEKGFWLLALLLEDVLDPDFFGADVRGNLQMAYIGGLGVRTLVVELAETRCPAIFAALGSEAFASSLGSVLDQWVLALFVGSVHHRLLEHLWDQLLLSRPERRQSRGVHVPWGMAVIASFALAALKCCGEQRSAGTEVLRRLQQMKQAGSPPETLSLEAGELIMGIRSTLLKWPEQDDGLLKQEVAQMLVELAGDGAKAARLWEAVRERKQRIVANAGDFDEQMMSLARRTHFTAQEIERLREEVRKLNPDAKVPFGTRGVKGNAEGSVAETRLDPATFKQVVGRAVPEFPRDLCGRLFRKLDAFGVGKLTFVELACGMSALSLGTMDEKLQVCFDLFDSEGRGALTLKDLGDLCTTLFRVALAQGFAGAKVASTDEVLGNMQRFNWSTEQAGSGDVVTELSKNAWRSPMPGTGRSARMSMPVSGHMMHWPGSPPSTSTASSSTSSMYVTSPVEVTRLEGGREQPWRSMLMRLLVAAHVHSPGGPLLVAFEDFRRAAHMEPALLALFSWCLPRPPDGSAPAWMDAPDQEPSLLRKICNLVCEKLSFLRGGRRG